MADRGLWPSQQVNIKYFYRHFLNKFDIKMRWHQHFSSQLVYQNVISGHVNTLFCSDNTKLLISRYFYFNMVSTEVKFSFSPVTLGGWEQDYMFRCTFYYWSIYKKAEKSQQLCTYTGYIRKVLFLNHMENIGLTIHMDSHGSWNQPVC